MGRPGGCLRNGWIGHGRDVADLAGTGRKWRSRDQELITLSRGRTTAPASTREGITAGIGPGETIRECLQERNDLVLLRIRQAELANRHVDVVRDLGHGPAVHPFGFPRWAVSRGDVERVDVARVVEVDELLQALDVAVVEELLLEVRLPYAGFGGGALWRRHGDIARRGCLHLAVRSWRKLCPIVIRACPRAETASEESS